MAWTARARLNVLFYANALFNALGAVILFAAPPRLDSLLALGSSSDFQWHLLAACSLSLAVVSFYAPTFKDPHAVRAVVLTFLTFNGVSAIVSVWAIVDGLPAFVWFNTAIHVVFFGLFWILGLSPGLNPASD